MSSWSALKNCVESMPSNRAALPPSEAPAKAAEVMYPAPFVNWLLFVTLVALAAIPSSLFLSVVVKFSSVCDATEKSKVPSES